MTDLPPELVEQAARALWEQQNPLESMTEGWGALEDSKRTVAWYDARAVLSVLLEQGLLIARDSLKQIGWADSDIEVTVKGADVFVRTPCKPPLQTLEGEKHT